MSRRTQRVASLIRQILGQALLSKIADPRIDPALTSITRVEVPEDLLTAKVYISTMGTEAQQQLALRAVRHASGRLQGLMAKQMSLRNTPILNFEIDKEFKKTLQTLDIIQRAMDEIHQKEQARLAAGGTVEAKPEGEEEDIDQDEGGIEKETERGEKAEDEDDREEETDDEDQDDDEDEKDEETDEGTNKGKGLND